MATAPTFEDLFDAATREAIARPSRVTREQIVTPGTDINIATAVGTAMAEDAAVYLQGEVNATRLGTALSVSEQALDQLGASEYGETRRGPESAIGPLDFTRDPSSQGTVVPAGTIVGTNGGVTYRTAVDLIFEPGEVGPKDVTGIATTAGPGGNQRAGSVVRILSQLADTTMRVTNPEAMDGGSNEETPVDFQARLQTIWPTARRGTLEAIRVCASTTPGIASASVEELLDSDGAPAGRVRVLIIGPGGAGNRSLAQRVRDRLEDWRGAGVPVIVLASQPRYIRIRFIGLKVLTGYNASEVLGACARALVANVNALQPGATLRLSLLIATAQSIPGLVVPSGTLGDPAADVVPASVGEVLRTALEFIRLELAAEPITTS